MENVENKETIKEVKSNESTVEETKEDKFIVLPEKLVQDIVNYLGTKPANETVNFLNGITSTAQYATMQPAPEKVDNPKTEAEK